MTVIAAFIKRFLLDVAMYYVAKAVHWLVDAFVAWLREKLSPETQASVDRYVEKNGYALAM